MYLYHALYVCSSELFNLQNIYVAVVKHKYFHLAAALWHLMVLKIF